jgi:tRNA (cmo5U34)-methyltransferase
LYVMTNATIAAFAAHAGDYDALRRRLVPCFDAFYGAAVAAAGRNPKRVLDLGAGTGLLSSMLLAAHPRARLVLVDGAAPMLDRARAALGGAVEAARVQDLTDPLPAGPFCAVVSALAIHHLDDAAKADLCARAFDVLAPGGVWVNAEQVAGDDGAHDAALRAGHEHDSRALGATDAEWAAAQARMAHDRCAPVAPQLAWLRDAGYADVRCAWRAGRFAVLTGRRPA